MTETTLCVVCGGEIEIPLVRPRSDTWNHTDQGKCVAVLRAQRETMNSEVAAWAKRAQQAESDLSRLRAAVEALAGELDRRSDSASYDAAACDDYARGLEVAYNNAADLVRALLPGGDDAKCTFCNGTGYLYEGQRCDACEEWVKTGGDDASREGTP